MTTEKRNTKQKAAIREALTQANRPLAPEEILQGAQHHYPTLGIATVYRNIQALVQDGWLEPVEIPGESTRYEVAGIKHHPHFHCNQCGKLFELEGCVAPVKPKVPKGFRAMGHEFFLYGLCAACVPRRQGAHA